jgi:hypothetical protein
MHISIRIKGHLNPSWQQGLEGLQIVHEEQGTSLLSGVLGGLGSALWGTQKDRSFELDTALARTNRSKRTGGETSV